MLASDSSLGLYQAPDRYILDSKAISYDFDLNLGWLVSTPKLQTNDDQTISVTYKGNHTKYDNLMNSKVMERRKGGIYHPVQTSLIIAEEQQYS